MRSSEELHRSYNKAAAAVGSPAAKMLIQELADEHVAVIHALHRLARESKCPLRDIDGHPTCGLIVCNFCSDHCKTARLEWATS